ncbi:MAG: MinD/ParA family protein [Phycisphaerales bacterium]|nr:MinD/ParA family protein [Phycisphaerales bacterium]MCB9857055.1 MinD/ParA family protein [Phycisphaerales bacterium]MCB9861818.1 MinD/ParA family protein [Phycisphaerales bacterium]
MTALPTDQATDLRRMMANHEAAVLPIAKATRTAKVIAVASGKGGVGKTSIAVNLAITLSKRGRRVVLIDADLGTANIDVAMNIHSAHDLSHVIRGERSLDDVAVRVDENLSVIAGASGIAGVADLGAFERQRLLEALGRMERESDVILLDCGAGISQNVLAFAQTAHRLLLVTTPEPTAVADVYALVKVLSRTPITPPIGLVVNCADSAREGRMVSDRVASVAARFLSVAIDDFGQILRDENMPLSIRRRSPLVSLVPRSTAARGVAILADRILSGDNGANPTPGFFRKLFGHFY